MLGLASGLFHCFRYIRPRKDDRFSILCHQASKLSGAEVDLNNDAHNCKSFLN